LIDRRVNEALELARGVHKTGLSKDKFTAVSMNFYMCNRGWRGHGWEVPQMLLLGFT